MITILGTSHVSTQSSKEVKEAVAEEQFAIVAIELDHGRLAGILTNKKATFTELRQALGMKGALLASVMRFIQEKIAANVGVIPGVEMRAALEAAAKHKKPVALIDQDIQITMKRLSKSFGWREIRRMVADSFKREKLSIHPDDDLVVELLGKIKVRYPRIYKAIVHERDIHMARQLVQLSADHPDQQILAVVGKGHVQGMIEQIKHINQAFPVCVWRSNEKN